MLPSLVSRPLPPPPLQGQGLASNEYTAKQEHLRRVKVLGMRERGPACFDFDFYKLRNPDLPIPPWTAAHMWDHFVDFGQHEGRVFRWARRTGVERREGGKCGVGGGLGGGGWKMGVCMQSCLQR